MLAFVSLVLAVLVVVVGTGGGKHVRADEEDPLQHAAPAVTRNRALQEILNKLATDLPPTSLSTTEKCEHEQLNEVKIHGEQVARFSDGIEEALRLTNLLNILYLSPLSSSFSIETGGSQPLHGLHRYNLSGSNVASAGRPIYSTELISALASSSLQAGASITTLGIAYLRGQSPLGDGLWGSSVWTDDRGNIIHNNIADSYNYQYDNSKTAGTRWFAEIVRRYVCIL